LSRDLDRLAHFEVGVIEHLLAGRWEQRSGRPSGA